METNLLAPPALRLLSESGYEADRLYAAQSVTPSLTGRPCPLDVALFGYELSYLPDFIADHTLVSERAEQKLAEIHERQTQFIQALWKYQTAAFSWRYVCLPAERRVRLYLLARFLARQGDGQQVFDNVWYDLFALGQAFGLPLTPLGQEALEAARCPWGARLTPACAVLQQEALVQRVWGPERYYVVHPFWRARDPFLRPMQSLVRQRTPTVLDLHLEPTQLSVAEMQMLGETAGLAQTVGELDPMTLTNELRFRRVDPVVQDVARVYARQARRLNQPFLISAGVYSESPVTTRSLAYTVGAAMVAQAHHDESGEQGRVSYTVHAVNSREQAALAARTLQTLVLTDWPPPLEVGIPPEKRRLRYLADAEGAATVFRLPIAMRGGVPGVAVRQDEPGFELLAGTTGMGQQGQMHLGRAQNASEVMIALNHLPRHALICGLPGSGKTNTCLYMLDQLQRAGVPFMVIEPAKTEYRGLLGQPGYQKLTIFTLGDETTSPFRLNPFELLPGVRVEVHLSALNTVINAAMPQFGALPSIIEEALERAYEGCGWRLEDVCSETETRDFPTMEEFYRLAIQVVEQRGYAGEVNDNIRAAVRGRLGSLLKGSKGRMYGCRRSLPIKELLLDPTVLELDALDEDAKALTMMFLLTLLREYRQIESRKGGVQSGELQHVLLIEEAHRVMENVQSAGNTEVAADTRAKAVRAISDFVVEMRAYGEAIIIADQSPEKLASDAMRNTNLKISHMLPGKQDREALAATMMMDEAQEIFMGKLRVGQAAVFMTGLEKASFMQVPAFKRDANYSDFMPDERVRQHMRAFKNAHLSSFLPFEGCAWCGRPCEYRASIEPVTRIARQATRMLAALSLWDERPASGDDDNNWRALTQVCLDAAQLAGHGADVDAAYCYLCHESTFGVTPYMRRRLYALAAARRGA